jgi:hypothetical protein
MPAIIQRSGRRAMARIQSGRSTARSAALGFSPRRKGIQKLSQKAPFKVPLSDHFSIAKPSKGEAIQHRLLCGFLETKIDLPRTQQGETPPLTAAIPSPLPSIPEVDRYIAGLRRTWSRLKFDPGLHERSLTVDEVFVELTCARRSSWDRHHDGFEGVKVVLGVLGEGDSRLGLPALGGLFDPNITPDLTSANKTQPRAEDEAARSRWSVSDEIR